MNFQIWDSWSILYNLWFWEIIGCRKFQFPVAKPRTQTTKNFITKNKTLSTFQKLFYVLRQKLVEKAKFEQYQIYFLNGCKVLRIFIKKFRCFCLFSNADVSHSTHWLTEPELREKRLERTCWATLLWFELRNKFWLIWKLKFNEISVLCQRWMCSWKLFGFVKWCQRSQGNEDEPLKAFASHFVFCYFLSTRLFIKIQYWWYDTLWNSI